MMIKMKKIAPIIKLIASDIDGVWTDAKMHYTDAGEFIKSFSTYDGMAVALLKELKIDVAVLTSENSEIVKRRAEKLRIKYVYINETEKLLRMESLCNRLNISLSNVAYIGDDVNDFEIMSDVGFSCTPNDGVEKIKEIVDYVTTVKGGSGVFREVADLILKFN